ncbi:MAG TPA: hypothetical protein VK926_06950 [Gaiellaceae bacterium]|nr:hypothetical protein [Gaiellaceae bacterium]
MDREQDRGPAVSSSDVFYAVLAEALDVPLATADRGLAEAAPNAILVS